MSGWTRRINCLRQQPHRVCCFSSLLCRLSKNEQVVGPCASRWTMRRCAASFVPGLGCPHDSIEDSGSGETNHWMVQSLLVHRLRACMHGINQSIIHDSFIPSYSSIPHPIAHCKVSWEEASRTVFLSYCHPLISITVESIHHAPMRHIRG